MTRLVRNKEMSTANRREPPQDGECHSLPACANCGKEGDDINNICNKCKKVKYCNAACKKRHRHKHKKECEDLRLTAEEDSPKQPPQDKGCSIFACANCGKGEGIELKKFCVCNPGKYCSISCQITHHPQHEKQCRKRMIKVFENAIFNKHDEINDDLLFKQPPPAEDCPLCFLTLPTHEMGSQFNPCCGKVICCGCNYALSKIDDEDRKCPFCRRPNHTSDEEARERERRLVEKGNTDVIHNLGIDYREGTKGYPKDYTKALEFWYRAAELGCPEALASIGYAYEYGQGVEIDMKKAVHYYELAAMEGNVHARHNLGIEEENSSNYDRALKHYMIATKSGDDDSLKQIKRLYSDGHATKDDYTKALRYYQVYLGEIKSRQRDEAAAYDDENRYY